jgi:hypothetical protein
VPDSSPQGIFLSYRRGDALPYARLLKSELTGRFPDARVFMDLDSIEPGSDFAEVIEQALGLCVVLVALIGRQWATLSDEEGNRRLDNPDDLVRYEIVTALERGVPVIPVLVDDARPLRRQELPAELHKLARLNALELSSGHYQYDANRLLDLIQKRLAAIGAPEEADRNSPEEADRKVQVVQPAGNALGEAVQQDLEPARMLQFRLITGEQVEIEAWVDDTEFPAGEFLRARKVRLDNGTELRQHRPVSGSQRPVGYDRLDNEILAGRRLNEVSEVYDWGSYPPELARLYGDEAASADPYTLFHAYVGQPLRDVVRQIIDDEFDAFLVGLLNGLCWLGTAGIAHRAVSPDTVLWDSKRRQVQITDFSRSTAFGVPRTPVTGVPGWVPKEQRPRTCYGVVGPRDDVWAACRLIFFVRHQGEDLVNRSQIDDSGLDGMFNGLFGAVFAPPEARPTAWNLLEDGLKRRNPVPPLAEGSAGLIAGRARFMEVRQRMHPGAPVPPGFNEDIDWMGNPGAARPPTAGNAGPPAAASATPEEATSGRTPGRAGGKRAESTAQADDQAGVTKRPSQFPWRRGN